MLPLGSLDLSSALLLASVFGFGLLSAWVLAVAALSRWRATAGLARALTPPAMRFLLAATLYGGVAASPAHAEPFDGLQLPDRPATAVAPSGHEVRPGDSLWTIAGNRLAPGASVRDVAEATEAWYTANTDVIGADPDVIVPGQQLAAPEAQDR